MKTMYKKMHDRRKAGRRASDNKFRRTAKSAIVVCAVGIVSFFIGQRVIPERDAVIANKQTENVTADDVVADDTSNVSAEETVLTPSSASEPVQTSTPVSVSIPAPAPPPPVPPPPPVTNQRQAATLKIERAAVATAVENRIPKGVSDKFSKDTHSLYYFTHVVGASDTTSTVMHRWYYEGKLVQTSILQIRSPSWRTHSRRKLAEVPGVPDITGNWKVEAVDSKTGKVLESAAFVIE